MEILQLHDHRTTPELVLSLSLTQQSSVDLSHRGNPGKSARHKGFISSIDVGQGKRFLEDWNPVFPAQIDDRSASNAAQTVVSGGGPHLTITNDFA